jgi:DNA polymerase-3 subunit beta
MKLSIDHSIIKALLLTSAKGDIRYYLNAICLDVSQGKATLVATQGHTLLAVPIEGEDLIDGEYIIDRSVFESVNPKKAGKIEFPLELLVTREQDRIEGDRTIKGEITITLTGVTSATSRLVDAKYPDWRRVIPRNQSKVPAQYKPEYVSIFGKIASLLSGKKDNYPTIHHNGQSGSLVSNLGQGAIGVIMPLRQDDDFPYLADWTLHPQKKAA